MELPKDWTVFLTVISGVINYVLGQIIVRLMIEPVQDLKRTIGLVSHVIIERTNIIQNPGVPAVEVMEKNRKC